MALFSDLHESLRDVMPPSLPFSGPYDYSEFHKPHEKSVEIGDGVEELPLPAPAGAFVPSFSSPAQKARFGSTKERKSIFLSIICVPYFNVANIFRPWVISEFNITKINIVSNY